MTNTSITSDALNRFRAAASQFVSGTAPRASRLLAVKDDIATLRKRGASYRTISELLTQNGIAASNTCVLRFCRRVLKEKPSRNPERKSPVAPPAYNGAAPGPASQKTPQAVRLANHLSTTRAAPPQSVPTESMPAKSRGPRIAKVELLSPDEKYE